MTPDNSATAPVLELTAVSKQYGALRPLRIEQLTIRAADRIALLGLDQPAAEVFINWFSARAAQETYSKIVLEASRRVDVDKSVVPGYIQPKPGVDYLDQYSYDWYAGPRKEALDKVAEILGR